jgi:hypothetical protein
MRPIVSGVARRDRLVTGLRPGEAFQHAGSAPLGVAMLLLASAGENR